MKHLRLSGLLRYVVALTLLFESFASHSQVQTPRYTSMTGNSGGYYEYLPQGYNSGSQSYPLIVFIHGIGEEGNGNSDLPNLLNCWTALPRLIQNGAFPATFTSGGQSFSFIVISPQFRVWPSPSDVNDVVNYAAQNYRVDPSRIYVTGLSMGGGAVWDFAGAYPTKATAIVPICGASTPDATKAQAIASAKLPVWATQNQNDPTVPSSNTPGWVNLINQDGGNAQMTIFPASGHDAWTATYTPSFTQNNLNIYQWMLQYKKGATTPAPVQPPVANAGANQTITLPLNSITLNGSGSNPDGSTPSFTWAQVSGPSSANFSSASSPVTTASGLVQGSYVFSLTVKNNNNGASNTSSVIITVNPAVVSSPTSGTTRYEAENWAATSGDVQTENTWDVGGGKDVGWINNGSWMDYSVNVSAAGTYSINLRVASPNSGAQLQIKSSTGIVLATVNVPNTGGYQVWQTVSANITLPAGSQTIRIQSVANPGWNINWFEIAGSGTATPPPPPPPTSGTTRYEAENWAATSGDVQTENTWDVGGGKDVGWINNGSWMDYSVNVSAAGTYAINLRVASPNSGAQLQIKSSTGTVLATVNVPNTGGYQVWQTVSANITLPAGSQTIRIQSVANPGWNINWFEIAGSGTATPPPPPPPTSGTTRYEAENWAATSGDVQTENTWDVGGGKDVGWINNGSWMDYSVNVSAAGTYSINLRVASPNSGAQLQIKSSTGIVLATVNVPNTGGYQVWQTVSANITLPAGSQTIRIQSVANPGWNINWFEIAGSGTATPPPPPPPTSGTTRYEAENWAATSGDVQTENTWDVGGGKDVGWINNGSWMDYSVNVSAAGTYAINLRVASPNSGAQLQIKSSTGTVLATVNVPNTGGYQVWQTVSANITLPAGSQTIRIQSVANPGWNINWFEIAGSVSGTSTGKTSGSPSNVASTTLTNLDIYPNPVTSNFVLQINNDLTGSVNVQVYDMSGGLQKQFSLTKSSTGSTQFYLSVGELAAANYIVKVTMTGWSDSKQISKQ